MTGRPKLTRADLPAELTPETLRTVPIGVLRAAVDPRSGMLTAGEQEVFDRSLRELMSGAASRVSTQLSRSQWRTLFREAQSQGGRRGGPGESRVTGDSVERLARRIEEQVGVAERLDPSVDWSFAQPAGGSSTEPAPDGSSAAEESAYATTDGQTVSDLEAQLTDQVELVQVMSDIAEISRRTYALEQQRDLASTRGVFFGFVVSLAVLVAGWAPLVIATWEQRWWTVGLTVVTCIVAGLVYVVVRRWQDAQRGSAGSATS